MNRLRNKMPLLDINGVQVNFPFTPYPCQIDYMDKVLTCLQKNQNGVIESPTGTGKTLSLLCSSLAWQESHKAQVELKKQTGLASVLSSQTLQNVDFNKISQNLQTATGSTWGTNEFLVPRIIYASRTHSQISQAVNELKRTAYSYVKSSVIGSREQLCIHQQVQQQTNNAAKVHLCRAKVAARNCHFYNNIEEFKKKSEIRKVLGSVVDIEDLIKTGHKTKTCPYYMARELKSDSDILFMPYNYLLDNKSRKAHGVELQGSVIIFDEAHNLEKICEESASFDLSSLDIATAIEETTKLAEKIAHLSETEAEFSQIEDSVIIPDFNLEDIIRLKQTLLEIEERLDKIEISSSGKTLPGNFIFEFLSQVNITWSTKNVLIDVLDRMTSFLGNDEGNSLLHTKGSGLTKFSDCLKTVFNQEPGDSLSLSVHQANISQHFRVYIQKKESSSYSKRKIDSWATTNDQDKKAERILSYWCFSPGHTMKDLVAHGVKVIILTSGTLSPLDSFTLEMQIPFPVQLENPHVIDKSQVWLGTLCKGPDGVVLNSEYKNRSSEEYQKSLGNTIVNFARIVPNGLLIFFPSYPLMDQCIEKWKLSNQWNLISQHKPIVVEPKGKAAFTEVMDEFYNKINDPNLNGAIFMAVCRGKVSEGLDFADINGRAVMITGLPFPPLFDPRVKLKMDFLRENPKNFKGLNGNMWYRQQATRAVNQAIGRVIRHNKDFGAILLCDTRFSSVESKNSLPLWVRHQAQVYSTFGPALRDIIKFFKEAEAKFPATVCKPIKKKEPNSGIISGASFEPSFSQRRRDHISIQYERACDVPCHIPSLRGSEDAAALYERYTAQKTKEKAKKRTLLEALETAEDQNHASVANILPLAGDSSKTFSTESSQAVLKKLPGKQKKIKLKTSSKIIFAESEEEVKQKIEEVKTKFSVESCKQYVNEVKTLLNKEGYRTFSSALAKYKQEGDIHAITPVLAQLFTDSAENYYLFRKFYRFARQKDKQYFARTCFDLTGLSCDIKFSAVESPPEDASSFVNFTYPNFSKPSDVSKDAGTSSSSVKESSTTVVAKNKEFRGYIPPHKNSCYMAVVSVEEDGSVSVHVKEFPDISGNKQRVLWSSDKMDCIDFKHDDRETYQELLDCGVINPKDGIFTPDMFVYPKTWGTTRKTFTRYPEGDTIFSTCVICDQAPLNGFRHGCGAICCFLCWKTKVFEGPPERKCPYPHCGSRISRKHLEPVKSANDVPQDK